MKLQWCEMIIKTLASAALLLGSAACATIPPTKLNGIDVAFGQTAYVNGPKILPIKLIEDSRCPMNARCIWAGRVRVLVAWVKPGGNKEVAMNSQSSSTVEPPKTAGNYSANLSLRLL